MGGINHDCPMFFMLSNLLRYFYHLNIMEGVTWSILKNISLVGWRKNQPIR